MNEKIKAFLISLLIFLFINLVYRFFSPIFFFLKIPRPLFEFTLYTLLAVFGIFFYRILKLKTSFNIKDTEPKYYLWCLLLIILLVIGDILIGDPLPIKVRGIFVAIFFPVFMSFSEEFITRVVVLKTLLKAFSFKATLVLQAVFFVLLHDDFRITAILYYFILGGIGMGLLMKPKKGHFFYPFIVHYVSLVIMLVMRL